MRLIAAVLLAGLLAAPAAASGFEQLSEIHAHSDAEMAVLKAAAEKGDAKAELAYGKALVWVSQNGKGAVTEADYRRWFQKAADQNLGEAWYWLAYTTTDRPLMATGFRRAAELGYLPAFDDVFETLLFRAAENADPVLAKHYLDLAKKAGYRFHDVKAGEYERTITACYEAGTPSSPPEEIAAIAKDGRADNRYAPNPNIRMAHAYANGWGVKRDPKRALAFVCRGADVPAELIAMVESLTQAGAAPKGPFLFCDHITSGMNGGQCSAFDQAVQGKLRASKFGKITATFTPAQKAAFDALSAASQKYCESHAWSEQDMSGSAHITFYEDERGRLDDAFLAAVKRFENGKLPPHGDFPAADRELNRVYRNTLKNFDWTDHGIGGEVKPDGLRDTQRLWLKLRDAWAAFGAARYPSRTADDWKAWATRERIKEIENSFPPTP